MSGRHSGGTSEGLRISALPRTLKLIFKLAPRQLNDEIALAKVELKRKGIQVGVAAAFLAVALVFVAFLVVGLIVAAIMGLATIMPAWLAALLVCGVFLLIAADRRPGGRRQVQEGHAAGSGGHHPWPQVRPRHRQGGLRLRSCRAGPGVRAVQGGQGRQGGGRRQGQGREGSQEGRRAGLRSAAHRSGTAPPAGPAPHATSPASATNSTRNSTSRPRPRPCWPRPR